MIWNSGLTMIIADQKINESGIDSPKSWIDLNDQITYDQMKGCWDHVMTYSPPWKTYTMLKIF
jgi:hypothetical protein